MPPQARLDEFELTPPAKSPRSIRATRTPRAASEAAETAPLIPPPTISTSNTDSLSFNFIRKSLNYGCIAANYVESTDARRSQDQWITSARDAISGERFEIRSKALINACGPWVDLENNRIGEATEYRHLFSKGVHLIVDRITDNQRVLTFFASDGRLFFLIPMGPKTCIGTTDTQVQSPEVGVTDERL